MVTAAICITLNNSLISKIYFPQCLFLKNYSLIEVVYLLITCNKTKFFLRKNTDRNGVNKKTYTQTKHLEKDNTGKSDGVSAMSLAGSEFLLFDNAKEASNNIITFFLWTFITKQKPELIWEILHVKELQVKKVSLNVPDFL